MPLQTVDRGAEMSMGVQKSALWLSGMLGQEIKQQKEDELSAWSNDEIVTPPTSSAKKKRSRKPRSRAGTASPSTTARTKSPSMPPISPPPSKSGFRTRTKTPEAAMQDSLETAGRAVDELVSALTVPNFALSPENLISRDLKSRGRTPDDMAIQAIEAAEAFMRCHTCPPAYGREDLAKSLPKLSEKYSSTSKPIDFRMTLPDPIALSKLVDQRVQEQMNLYPDARSLGNTLMDISEEQTQPNRHSLSPLPIRKQAEALSAATGLANVTRAVASDAPWGASTASAENNWNAKPYVPHANEVRILEYKDSFNVVGLAPDETVILLHPPLSLVGVSIVMERERQQNDSLVNG